GAKTVRAPGAAPLPGSPIGALIARVGNGTAFLAGTSTDPIRMTRDGRLFLGINDDIVVDNQGEFRVTISVQRSAAAAVDRASTPQPPTPQPPARTAQESTVVIKGVEAWKDTGIDVRPGDTIR